MPNIKLPKYPADFFLEFQSVDRFLYRVSDLYDIPDFADNEIVKRLDDCHIYLLGKRPRLSVTPGSVRVDDRHLRFQANYQIKGELRFGEVSIPRTVLEPEEVEFQVSDYPHREIISRDVNGIIVGSTLLANFAHIMLDLSQEARDLEIVYVGKGLHRSAQDRLEHHATLQRILAEINSNDPDFEVFALVHAFNYRKNCYMFKGVPSQISGQAARDMLSKAASYKMPLLEQINLIEASCISYFQSSRYNKQYLNFPLAGQKILRSVSRLDYAALIVQLDQTNIGDLRIFSESIEPQSTHYITVDFRKKQGFSSMFDGSFAHDHLGIKPAH